MVTEDIESRSSFLAALEWLMAVTVRYDCPIEFSLIHIEYGDKNQLGEAYGAQEAVQQLDEMRLHLKSVFRKTDMVARNGSDFWVVVPCTPSTEKLQDKVREILGGAEHEGLRIVNPEISIFNVSDQRADLEKQFKDLNALALLEYLKANKKILAEHTFCLYPVQ